MSRDDRTRLDACVPDRVAQGAQAEPADATCTLHELQLTSESSVDGLEVSLAKPEYVQPSPKLKSRLMEHARLLAMAPDIASFFSVNEESARARAEGLERTEGWLQVVRGLAWLPFGPGAGMCAGFMRIESAFKMPSHQHAATEHVLVLAGRLRSHDGSVIGPGETLLFPGGTAHWFGVDACPEVLAAVRVS